MITVTGKIIKGLGLGSQLGFPTINLKIPEAEKAKLNFGVYAVKIKISGKEFFGVAHYGPRHFHKAPVSFEVHCFDFYENATGKKAEVEIIKKIRDVRRFESEEDLKKQIEDDIRRAKEIQ